MHRPLLRAETSAVLLSGAPNDPPWDEMVERARVTDSNPSARLSITEVHGSLKQEPRFAGLFLRDG